MKISISATNPCHLYPLARELAKCGALAHYYSGYPGWKLPGSDRLALRAHTLRTNIVYGLLKFLPARFRPESKSLFVWQDCRFDRWVGRHLEPCDFIHAMPGQALHTFRAARRMGIRTVLNHATGPVRQWVKIMEPEYARAGLRLTDHCPYDAEYFRREDEEYALADFHCAASSVVREQLLAMKIPGERIWTVPYGADEALFHRGDGRKPAAAGFRIVFAGMCGLRKGMRTLFQALELAGANPGQWRVDFYGGVLAEADLDRAAYRGAVPLQFHGAVSQAVLAKAFRGGDVLVLPSLEEGFGLVVPQALGCGMPAIVSSATGARDLVRHRENGSIFPTGDAAALAKELLWWSKNRRPVLESHPWNVPAQNLLKWSQST